MDEIQSTRSENRDIYFMSFRDGRQNEYEIWTDPRVIRYFAERGIEVKKPDGEDLMLIGPNGQEWLTEIKLGRCRPAFPKKGDPYMKFKCHKGRGISSQIDKFMVKRNVTALNQAIHRDNYHPTDRVWVIVRLDFAWPPKTKQEADFLASIDVHSQEELKKKTFIAKMDKLASNASNRTCKKRFDEWKRVCYAMMADPTCIPKAEYLPILDGAIAKSNDKSKPKGKKPKKAKCDGNCGFVPTYPRIGFTPDGKLKAPWYEIK